MSNKDNVNEDRAEITYAIAFPSDEIGRIGEAIKELTNSLEMRYRELQRILAITARVNAGVFLNEILESVYKDFQEFIPYDRIGFSLIDDNREQVTAHWAKAEYKPNYITKGYSQKLAGSSLQRIIETQEPRIINNLPNYLQRKPESESTQLIVKEGIRSSLTCPLIANGVPVGFMFFSSRQLNTYSSVHVEIFQQIASQLSVMVEKAHLIGQLDQQKRELQAKNEQLESLNALKNSFLGIAAHDLRNPLNTILIGLSFFLDDRYALEPTEQKELVNDLCGQAQYMVALLNDLLDISHIESGKLSISPKSIDVAEYISGIIKRHRSIAKPKSIQIKLNKIPDGKLNADPIRIRQVLDNLISNAIKFSPPETTITVCVGHEDDQWQFTVTDQGPGLTEEDTEKLFTEFARLSAKPTSGEKSTGLGLAIVKRVIEAHGGVIGVNSKPGEGATFWFMLPDDA